MKISIITATYNSGATVADTIESVLRQDYDDWEHIIVDGCSTDDTLEVVRKYEPRYAGRLRLISEKDSGLYDAMNKGIGMACGDVVGILNSDDFYASDNILSTVADGIAGHDAVYGDIRFVNAKDLSRCVRYYSSAVFRRWLMRFGFMPAHPSFYCRKVIFDKYGCFDTAFKTAADFELLLRFIFVNRITTLYIPRCFVTMRIGGASTSGLSSYRKLLHDRMSAYRKNRVFSTIFHQSLRYAYVIMDLALMRTKRLLG